jgi:hypothetical protein
VSLSNRLFERSQRRIDERSGAVGSSSADHGARRVRQFGTDDALGEFRRQPGHVSAQSSRHGLALLSDLRLRPFTNPSSIALSLSAHVRSDLVALGPRLIAEMNQQSDQHNAAVVAAYDFGTTP